MHLETNQNTFRDNGDKQAAFGHKDKWSAFDDKKDQRKAFGDKEDKQKAFR